MKIFITGGCGTCASALSSLPYEKSYFDKEQIGDIPVRGKFIQGNIQDIDLLKKTMKGNYALVHLAASDYYPDFSMGDGLGTWNSYLENNIRGLKTILDVAVDVGVEKVVFASTHRVMGMYEQMYAPEIYEMGHGIMINHLEPVDPDSIYAVTKLFGENLGKLLSNEGKLRFYAIRICSVRNADADHPYAYAEYGVQQKRWPRNSSKYHQQVKRLKGLWQSRRDFVQMVDLCIKNETSDYDIFYGVSDNSRRWFDIEHAKNVLGYDPKDNSEKFNETHVEILEEDN